MYFVSSAIQILPKDSQYPIIVTGKRHWNCLETIANLGIQRDKSTDIHGFIVKDDDNNTMFVDRHEGSYIARSLGYKLEFEHCLYSEDIWPDE